MSANARTGQFGYNWKQEMNASSGLELAPPEGRLDSWKEIATYLGRNERTVRRWEQLEGLPVHRLMHEKKGSVYAYRAELDAWRASRKLREEEDAEVAVRPGALGAEPIAKERTVIRLRVLVGVAAALLAAGLGIWIVARSRVQRPSFSSVAVLPFDNLSHDQAQEWFSDGMTEVLITELSKVRSLRVISRTSVMQYKGGRKPLKQVGSELRVDAVVEGSALRVGDRVRITAQLIATSSDTHLWGRDFDRDIRDVLELQKEVAGIIAQQVGATLRTGKSRTVNPEAMAAYLKGLYHFDRVELSQAIDLAREAIRLDPQMAQAHELLAMALLLSGDSGDATYTSVVPEARASLQRALELEPDRGISWSWLGWSYFVFEHDWAQAEKRLRQGFELDPATGNNYAYILAGQGRFDQATYVVDQALLHDPVNPLLLTDAGRMYHMARRYDVAIQLYRKAMELNPTSDYTRRRLPHPQRAGRHLIFSLLAAGRGDEAFDVFIKGSNGDPAALDLQKVYRSRGWMGVWRLLIDRYPKNAHDKFKAWALICLGLRNEALNELEALEKQGTSVMIDLENPNYDSLRNEPRFKAMMKRVGYPESMWR